MMQPIATAMQLTALLNTTNSIHNSPTAERFYRLQTSRLRRLDLSPASGSTRQRKNKSHELTRDERLKIKSLYEFGGFNYREIVRRTGHSYNQVRYACNNPVTPRSNRRGRKPLLGAPEIEALRQLVLSNPLYRKLS